MSDHDYAINIFWSAEDGEYIAIVPDLRGCSASGATPEEALKEVQIAKGLARVRSGACRSHPRAPLAARFAGYCRGLSGQPPSRGL
jgi:hypothetical protein